MACADSGVGCKGTKKGQSEGLNLSTIANVLGILKAAFTLVQKPVTPIPPVLLMVGAKLRPGLSARNIASRIISKQSEAGAPAGDIYSEGNNVSEAMETIRVQEIINAIHTESKVEITIPPGTPITAAGVGNLGAPIVVQGATTAIASGDGILR
jgi:hypothetical protein